MNHLFPTQIQKYEKKLIDLIVKSQESKWRSKRESYIIAFFLIHKQLTQNQVRDLSLIYYSKNTKKGISVGVISSTLNNFTKFGFMKREKRSQQTNEYIYSIESDIGKMLIESFRKSEQELIKANKFLKEQEIVIKSQLKNKNKQNYDHFLVLQERIQSLIIYFDQVLDIFSIMQMKSLNSEENHKIKTIVGKKQNFNEIESKVINLLARLPNFSIMKKDYSKILQFFITRKSLTQIQLKKLTNLSTGQISQGINILIEHQIIKIANYTPKEQKSRTKTYIMEPLTYLLLKRLHDSYQVIIDDLYEIKIIQKELEQQQEKLQKCFGFDIISEFISNYLHMEPLIKQIQSKIQIDQLKE